MNSPAVLGILETAVHVADLDRSFAFYQRIFGFRLLFRQPGRLYALAVGGKQVLLLFQRGCCREPLDIPGGRIPPHDGSGTLHFAFGMDRSQVQAWRDRLRDLDIPVSSEVEFPGGGRSIYFRDPDDHLVELATPEIWNFGSALPD